METLKIWQEGSPEGLPEGPPEGLQEDQRDSLAGITTGSVRMQRIGMKSRETPHRFYGLEKLKVALKSGSAG